MTARRWYAGGNVAVGSAWASTPLGALVAESSSEDVPAEGMVARVEVDLSSLVGATALTCFLTYDEDGRAWFSPSTPSGATQTISPDPSGDNTYGGAVFSFGQPFVRRGDSLVVWLKLDAGTGTAAVRVVGETGQPFSRTA